jgi:F-type H+-transporting ATPase subunit b
MHIVILAEAIQLMPDGTLLLHIAIILLMIYVLNRTLFKPVNKILAEREEMARTGKGTAAEIMQKVEAGMSNYEQTLQQARTDGYHFIEQARAEASQQRQSAIESVREELARLVDENRARLNQQTAMARAVLEADARRIAAQLKNQILG